MKIDHLKEYLDEILSIRTIDDESLNGLQVQNSGTVTTLGLAVDSSITVLKKAHEMGADALLVHHGLFWGKPVAMAGNLYERIRVLVDSDMALYAAHLPLDMHHKYGNNVGLVRTLGWTVTGNFGLYHGNEIGKYSSLSRSINLEEVVFRLKTKLNCNPIIWPFGEKKVKKIALVSGNGISLIDDAIKIGADTMITGEPSHGYYWIAKETRLNVVFGGHYATETIGVKMLGKHLEKRFKIRCVFIDQPTGL